MASKKAVCDLIEKICEFYGGTFTEKKVDIWCEVMAGDDYPDKLMHDAFIDYCESNTRPMMIADVTAYRARRHFDYRELDKFNRDW